MYFVDLKQETLNKMCLERGGLERDIIEIIEALYKNNKMKVKTLNEECSRFETKKNPFAIIDARIYRISILSFFLKILGRPVYKILCSTPCNLYKKCILNKNAALS